MRINRRIKRNWVFKGVAEVGKSTMGRFYGFKFQIVINDPDEILNFFITLANVDDSKPLKNESFSRAILGKLFADNGYISKNFTDLLFVCGIL